MLHELEAWLPVNRQDCRAGFDRAHPLFSTLGAAARALAQEPFGTS